MSSSGKRARGSLAPGVRFFLCACVFCLGIHFLVNDLAFFNLSAAGRGPASKTASLRIADNDHQEDGFSGWQPAGLGGLGLTLPLLNQPVFVLNRAISPLFSPPKA